MESLITGISVTLVIFLLCSVLGYLAGKFAQRKLPKSASVIKGFALTNFVVWIVPFLGFFVGFFTIASLSSCPKDKRQHLEHINSTFIAVAILNIIMSFVLLVLFSFEFDSVLLADYLA